MPTQSDYPEEDWLALSGLQHYAFCKRQWALIHLEQQWQDNYLTTAGSLEHDRAHDYAASETRGDLLIMRGLRVFSSRLGITGACDVVEFRASSDGVTLHGRAGLWSPYPIEYKHGRSKSDDDNADRLQLCAETMCLEDMLACSIPEGALFYQQTKHRERVLIDDDLREQVTVMTQQMHELFRRGHTPKVRVSKACRACSLRDICLPKLMKKNRSARHYIDEILCESTHGGEIEGAE
ncbi:CRISPR-associated protein Cas4 [Bifidobacterium callitrichos]|uniref:CRISPR-associated exonuclease Cas4 n=1 Tax=Bifidobacterium callitrichos TaxID=762209 RepID=A0A5M9ZFE5_9BIFI|nr:CRISPR-associated protein Cas4 [Bifidobacterium callitrichos]KAA8817663.1 CRISPR-associated protein Cas4 [Bifidobacterium callitrichos]